MTKNRKTSRRKNKRPRRSKRANTSALKRLGWALVIVIIASAAAAAIYYLQHDSSTDKTDAQDRIVIPEFDPPSSEQEVAELKEQEVRLAQKLMQDFPAAPDPIIIMGNVHNRHGKAIEAIDFWNKALKINPNRADIYKGMGWLAIKKGNFEEALAQYQKALRLQPRIPEVYANMANALMILGRHDEAVIALQKEIQISPDSTFAWFLLGQASLQKKEYDSARKYYETAVRYDPEYVNAYYGLSTVCARLGDKDNARQYSEKFKTLKAQKRERLKEGKSKFDDFLETQESSALTYVEVGRVYLDNGQLDKAEHLLLQAAGLFPSDTAALKELASLYKKNNQLDKTLQVHEMICEIKPRDHMSFVDFGMVLTQLNRNADAEKAFRKAIEVAPKKSAGYRYLASLFLKAGTKLPEARRHAQKAVALEPSAFNYFVLTLAHNKNGDRQNARIAIRKALDLQPRNPQYLNMYRQLQ